MKNDSGKSDAIVEYLMKVWENGGDMSKVSDKEAIEAVMEIRRRGPTYEPLKNSDIPKLSDEELEFEVMDWIRSKAKDPFNPYEDLKSLPKQCQAVYSCRTVADEVANGGVNQVFFNIGLPLAEMSIEGFLELGAPKLSRVMEKAVAEYRQNKNKFDAYRNGTIDSYSAFCKEGHFDKFNEDFVAEINSVSIAGYIRANAVFFGDKTQL